MSSHRDIQKHKKHARSQKRYEASWGGKKGQKKKARNFKILKARAKDEMVRVIREHEYLNFMKLFYGTPTLEPPIIKIRDTEECTEVNVIKKYPYETRYVKCDLKI